MTKIIKKLSILLVIMWFFSVFSFENVSYAKDENNNDNDFSQYVEEVFYKLDTNELSDYFNSLEYKNELKIDDVKDLILKISNGELELSFEDSFKLILNGLLKSVLSFLPSIISVVIISIFGAFLKNLNMGFIGETGELIEFICNITSITIVLNEVLNIYNLTVNTVGKMQHVMQIIFPLLLTLSVALGSGTTFKTLLSTLASSVISIINNLVLPLFFISVVLAIVGNLSKTIKLNKMSTFFKKSSDVILLLIFSTFMSILTATGIMGKTNYGIAVNSTKFALKSYVPVIGEYISDGFDVVYLGSILVKNALGVTGIVIAFLTIIYPLIKIISFRLILLFTSALLEPIGDEKTSDILHGIYKSTGILLSVILGVAFMFFLCILLLVNSYNLGVL